MLTYNRFLNKSLAAILSFVLIFSLFAPQVGNAADHSANPSITSKIEKTVEFYTNNKKPLTSWWDIVALWGAGVNLNDGSWTLPDWKTVDPKLDPNEADTTHVRYIFGLLAMGENPSHAWETNRNLYAELAEQQDAIAGNIGNPSKHIWAMQALDTGAKLGHNVGKWDAAAKQKAVDYLLSLEDNGSFGGIADYSGMALLALGNYQNDSAVQAAIARIKAYLKPIAVNSNYVMFGNNSNTMSTVVSGLSAVQSDVLSSEWTFDNKTVLDSFPLFEVGDGSFKWKQNDQNFNAFATVQTLIALLDIKYQKTVFQRLAEIQPLAIVNVKVQVDGISASVYGKSTVNVKQYSKPVTALDALEQALDSTSPPISYTIVTKEWGAYVSEIAGQKEAAFGGWDGWVYEVNGVKPSVGADAYKLKENDEIRFYYSHSPQISSTTRIISNEAVPSVDIKLVGDEFSNEVTNVSNWAINSIDSGLTVQSIEKIGSQQVKLNFTGTATDKPLTIEALGAATGSKQNSNKITLKTTVTVDFQVDGINAPIYAKQAVTLKNTQKPATALDVFKVALDQANPKVPYKITVSDFGSYVSEIAGQKAATFGGWDGWMYVVNGKVLEVGADEYKLKENDVVRFYYSRWAAISTQSKIDNQASNPSVSVTLVGDEFTSGATNAANWKIDVGATELKVKSLVQDGNKVTIAFEGTAKQGTVTIQALDAAVVGNKKSAAITVTIPAPTSPPGPGGPGPGVPAAQTVTFSVEKGAVSSGDIVAPFSVTLKEGDTAFTVLQRVLGDKGITLKYSGSDSSVYVQAIGGLAEFAHGPKSGWMYAVNGTNPEMSAGAYKLKNGDNVRWYYTKDGGAVVVPPVKPGETPKPPVEVKYSDEAKISGWAQEAVKKATALGFMQGTSTENATFEPKRQLTRAEFAALVVKYAGFEPKQADADFTDVSKTDWYYGYVAVAKEKGLMSGLSETSFAPKETITRQEMAVVLVRLKGLSVANAPQAAIKDRHAVAEWAAPYVNVAYQNGLMTGANGLFNPEAVVTREMVAVTIMRLHEMK